MKIFANKFGYRFWILGFLESLTNCLTDTREVNKDGGCAKYLLFYLCNFNKID